MSETRLVGDTLAALNSLEGCYAWRNNTGSALLHGRMVRFSEPGASDVLCCFLGRFVVVELKTLTGRQSAVQKAWQAKVEAAGALYVLGRTVPQVLAAMGVRSDHPRRLVRNRVIHR